MTQTIPYFIKNYDGKDRSICKCIEIPPRSDSRKKETVENEGSYWQADPIYYNIKQINFKLEKGSDELHSQFWDDLVDKLSKLDI